MPEARGTFNIAETAREAALMRRVAEGDRDAFATIIESHQERVWAVAYRFMQRRDDADDISQEAFIRLWNAAGRWEPAARLSTWLYRVSLRDMEARMIHEALRAHGGNRLAAARALGIHPATLFRKAKTLGIALPETDGRSKRSGRE